MIYGHGYKIIDRYKKKKILLIELTNYGVNNEFGTSAG